MKLKYQTKAWITTPSQFPVNQLATLSEKQLAEAFYYTQHDMSSSGWLLVGSTTVVVEMGPDLNNKQVEMLEEGLALAKEKFEESRKEFEYKCDRLQDMIDSLKVLEHKRDGHEAEYKI